MSAAAVIRSEGARRPGWVHPMLMCGIAITVGMVVVSLIAPYILPHSPTHPNVAHILDGPSWSHPFGTDESGYDVLARVLYAPRVDLLVALVATAGAVLIGVPIGLWVGFYTGWRGVRGATAFGIMRAMDTLQAFPVFVLALALVASSGRSVTNVILAIVFVNAPVFVRLVRADVLRIRERAHVDAAFLVGNSRFRIVRKHILPLSIGPVLVQFSVTAGFAILLTAGLSFIGAGVRPPTAEWGLMISAGSQTMITGAWWTSVFPGLFLGLAVLGLALAGDGIGKLVTRV
jgi:peptide/nickel transport system permease protein